VVVFARSKPDVERQDIQFHMQPLSADKPGEGAHKFSADLAPAYLLQNGQWHLLCERDLPEQLVDLIAHARQRNATGEYQQGGGCKKGFLAYQTVDHLAIDDRRSTQGRQALSKRCNTALAT